MNASRVLAAGAGAVLSTYGVFRLMHGSLDGYRGDGGGLRPPSYELAALFLVLGFGLLAWGAWGLFGESAPREGERHERTLLGAAAIAGAILVLLVGRDLSVRPDGDVVGDARLLHLFSYNYKRAWPDSLDFTSVFLAVTLGAAVSVALMIAPKLRRLASVMLCGIGLAFGAFTLDVYFMKTSQHWGQRETIEAYYKLRRGPGEPLIAYQMNWKGENFYTGNHVPAFVSSGEKFKQYIKEQRDRGVATMFFECEHGRVSSLRGELSGMFTEKRDSALQPLDERTRTIERESVEVLTDKQLNNKFTLVRVRFE